MFVDTSGWVAFFNKADSHHTETKLIWERLIKERARLCTSDYIIDETITLLRSRAGYQVSREGGEALLSSRLLDLIHVSRDIIQAAWVFYKKYKDHDLSFTDCASFVIMNKAKISHSVQFDRHFDHFGFHRPEP